MIKRLRKSEAPEIEMIKYFPAMTQLDFADIVQAETTVMGRRMLDWWATPADVTDLEADRRLDATLNLLWRKA